MLFADWKTKSAKRTNYFIILYEMYAFCQINKRIKDKNRIAGNSYPKYFSYPKINLGSRIQIYFLRM